jgi:hypothetical protein
MEDGKRLDGEFGKRLIAALGLGHLRVTNLAIEVGTPGKASIVKVGVLVTADVGGLVCALVKDQRYQLQPDGVPDTMTVLERPATPE